MPVEAPQTQASGDDAATLRILSYFDRLAAVIVLPAYRQRPNKSDARLASLSKTWPGFALVRGPMAALSI